MSHTTKISGVKIRDIRAIEQAVADLQRDGANITLVRNSKPRMYFAGQGEKCDYVLRLDDGKYDVGLKKEGDDTYSLQFDEYMNHVGAKLGAACPLPNTPEGRAQHQVGKFMQAYSVNAAKNTAAAQGYVVEGHTVDKDGNVHLTIGGHF